MKIKLVLVFALISCVSTCFASAIVENRSSSQRSAIQSGNRTIQSYKYEDNEYLQGYKSALEEVQKRVAKNPNDYSLYPYLVELYLKTEDYESAFKELSFLNSLARQNKLNTQILNDLKSLKTSFANSARYGQRKSSLYSNMAVLSIILEDNSTAQKYLLAASRGIDNQELFSNAADMVFNSTQNYEIAVSLIDKMLMQNPNNVILHKLKADYLVQINKKDEAVVEYTKVLALKPQYEEVTFSLYKILSLKNISEKDMFKKMFPSEFSNEEKCYSKLANILLKNDDIQGALSYANILVKKYPENADGFVLLSEIYRRNGKLQESYEALKQVRDKADDNETISKYNVMLAKLSDEPVEEANSLMNTGLYSQALSVLESANQDNLYVILGMARANYYLGNKRVAFEQLNKAMTFYPNNADVFYYFAYIFYEEKDYESAQKYLKKTFEVSPNHKFALSLTDAINTILANKYMSQITSSFEMQNYTETMRLVNEALAINPKSSALYLYKGLVYISQNQYAKATAPLYKAIDIDKNNISAYFYLAEAFDNLSEPQNALSYYEKFIRLVPSDNYGESEKIEYAKARIQKLKTVQ